jgi:hypothetical protein
MFLAASILFLGLTAYGLRGGWTGQGRFTVVGFDTQSLAMGGLAVTAAVYFFGALYGLALTLAVAIHEFGHAAAYRMIGHSDARFRLVPLMGGYAISDRLPAAQV